MIRTWIPPGFGGSKGRESQVKCENQRTIDTTVTTGIIGTACLVPKQFFGRATAISKDGWLGGNAGTIRGAPARNETVEALTRMVSVVPSSMKLSAARIRNSLQVSIGLIGGPALPTHTTPFERSFLAL